MGDDTRQPRRFPKEILRDLIDEGEDDEYKYIATLNLGKSRWTSRHVLVFSFEGELWGVPYEMGLTEAQYIQPFEYQDDHITCFPYRVFEKTITTYEPIKSGQA